MAFLLLKKGQKLKKTLIFFIWATSLLSNEINNNNFITIKETKDETCTIKFQDLVNDSLESHPSVLVSKEMIEGAKAGVSSAKWGYYPTPSVDYSYKNNEKNQLTLRLEQPIYTGGKLDAAYDKASAYENEANANHLETKYKLTDNHLKILKSYFQSKKKIETLKENLKQFDELSSMVDRMIKAGVLSNADKNLLESKIAAVNSDLVMTKSKYKIAKIQFEILVSKKIDCAVEFDYVDIFKDEIKLEALVNRISQYHPALRVLDGKILGAQAGVSEAKSNVWPTLSVRAEHREGALYKGSTDENEDIVYMAVSANFGAGLSAASNIKKANLDVSKLKFERLKKEKELTDELISDYISYNAVVSNLSIINSDLKTAFNIYESNKRLFLSQKKSWLDVVNALADINRQKVKYSELNVEKQLLEYNMALKTGYLDLNSFGVIND